MTEVSKGLENPFEVKTNNTDGIPSLNVPTGSVSEHMAHMSLKHYEDFDDSLALDSQIMPEDESGRIDVKISTTDQIPLSWLNRLKQTRQEYDPEKIVALAKSIEMTDDEGRKILKLLGPLQVVVCDDDQLPTFLADHADFYGEKTDPDSLQRGEDGLWYLVDAGHRRSLAFEYLCKRYNIDPSKLHVPSALLRDMDFDSALGIQARENEHDRPPVTDEAMSIDRYFKYRQRRQKTMPTHKQVADHFGVTERKVGNALRFGELPAEVQAEIKKGHVTWTHGLHLHQLMRALNVYYPEKYKSAYTAHESTRTLKQDVTDELMTVVKKLRSKELDKATAAAKSSYIDAKIKAIRESMLSPELFQLEFELTPGERRKRAETALAKKAISIAKQTIGNMALSKDAVDDLYELRDMIDGIFERQGASEVEPDDAMFDLTNSGSVLSFETAAESVA